MSWWLLAALAVVAPTPSPGGGVDHPAGPVDRTAVMVWAGEHAVDEAHAEPPPEPVAAPTTVAATPAGPATVPGVDNDLNPQRDLDECISALPQPGCGSASRAGWRQVVIFGLLVVAIAFIAWRVIRGARRREGTTTDDT